MIKKYNEMNDKVWCSGLVEGLVPFFVSSEGALIAIAPYA